MFPSLWTVPAIWYSKREGEKDDEDRGSVKKRDEVLVRLR
jgi:hypothetical protein